MFQNLAHSAEQAGCADPAAVDEALHASLLDQRWRTPDEVCSILKIKPEKLRSMARNGTGPPFLQVAPYVRRYPEARLLAWMQDRYIESERPQAA